MLPRQGDWKWPLRILILVLAVLSLTFGAAGTYGIIATLGAPGASAASGTAGSTAIIPDNPQQAVNLADPAHPSQGTVPSAPSVPSGPSVPSAPTATISYLRFVHAAGNLPAISVQIDQVPSYNGLTFAQATNYIQVTPGAHTVTMVNTATPSTVYATVNVNLSSSLYSLAIYGLEGAAFPMDRIQATLFVDPATVSGNDASVRVINLGVARPPLDVLMKRGNLPRRREFWNVAYTHDTGYLNFPPGSYTFAVGNNPTYIVQNAFYLSSARTLHAQTPNTAWLIGGNGLKVNGSPFRVFLTEDIVSTDGNG